MRTIENRPATEAELPKMSVRQFITQHDTDATSELEGVVERAKDKITDYLRDTLTSRRDVMAESRLMLGMIGDAIKSIDTLAASEGIDLI